MHLEVNQNYVEKTGFEKPVRITYCKYISFTLMDFRFVNRLSTKAYLSRLFQGLDFHFVNCLSTKAFLSRLFKGQSNFGISQKTLQNRVEMSRETFELPMEFEPWSPIIAYLI